MKDSSRKQSLSHNLISLCGMILAAIGFILGVTLIIIDAQNHFDNPYTGIFTYMVVPAILIGDFNAAPLSPCHNIFTGKNQHSAKIKTYFQSVFQEPFPGTHHGFTGDANGDQIDWILYRGALDIKACKIDRDPIEDVYPSDHFPLHALFEWST